MYDIADMKDLQSKGVVDKSDVNEEVEGKESPAQAPQEYFVKWNVLHIGNEPILRYIVRSSGCIPVKDTIEPAENIFEQSF